MRNALAILFTVFAACTAGEPANSAVEADMAPDADAALPITCGDHAFVRHGQCICEIGYGRTDTDCERIAAVAPTPGDLLIEELYYSGAAPNGSTERYFADQFIELVNATDQPLDVSGVMIADVFGLAGPINPGQEPDGFAQALPDEVVLLSVFRLPEGARVEAGGRLVIAQDGTNHRPFSTIDLSGADFETFVAENAGDDDHPTVPNLEIVEYNGGFDWLVTVFGPGIVILEAGTELGTAPEPVEFLTTAPTSAVLDGVEALMDDASGDFKRLPAPVDAGFSFVSGTYVGQSLHRREQDGVFQDTNDSSADFTVGEPDPGRPPDPKGVFGDPWIELGTGTAAFEPVDDGDELALVMGIQGGFHIDASVRFGGFGPDGIVLAYEAVDEEAQRISFVTQAELWEESVLTEEDGWSRVGDRIVLDVMDPTPLIGETAILRVTAELGGQTWSDERRVVILGPE